MMHKTLFSLFALLAVIGGGCMALWSGNRAHAGVVLDAAAQAQILASTIQIEMFDAGRVESGARYVRSAGGLGTVVQGDGGRFIITHNHWSIPDGEVNRVEFRQAAGEPLLVLDGAAFHSLVRYQDGGTMLLEAPPELEGVVPATLGDGATLVAGDSVWLARRDAEDGSGVGVVMAQVERIDEAVVPGRLRLRGPERAVAPGDSGGGVWRDGQLVGNLWTITMAEAGSPWGNWFGAPSLRPTGFILAGMQPLGGATGVSAGDLEANSGEAIDFERGPQR